MWFGLTRQLLARQLAKAKIWTVNIVSDSFIPKFKTTKKVVLLHVLILIRISLSFLFELRSIMFIFGYLAIKFLIHSWFIFLMQWRRLKAQTKFLFPAQAMKILFSHTHTGAQALTPTKATIVGAFLIF